MESDNQHTVTLVEFAGPTGDAIYINPKHVAAVHGHASSRMLSVIGLVGASNEVSQIAVMGCVKDVASRIAVNVIDGNDPERQGG